MTMLTVAQQSLHRFWFGNAGNSLQAEDTEKLYMFILWVSIISFAVLMGAMVWFVLKYRRSAQHKNYQVSSSHNTVLELGWSIVPLIVMVPIFFWGMKGYVDKQAAPTDSEEIMVRGQKWDWTISYDNGGTAGTETAYITESGKSVPVFYVPAGRPVKFILTSGDVIHSFYIPDFRTKIDVFPNRYTSMWIDAKEPSTADNSLEWTANLLESPYSKKIEEKVKVYGHAVYCAEYCGENHSEMAALVRVVDPKTYDVMKAKATEIDVEGPPDVVGEKLRARYGCSTCHTTDGSVGTGPTWKSGWGHTVTFEDGGTATFDENYIRESILNPAAHIHQGFPNQMPSFQSQLGSKPEVIDAFIRYIKYINGVGGGAGAGPHDESAEPAGEEGAEGSEHAPAHEPAPAAAPAGAHEDGAHPAPEGQEHDHAGGGAHE